MFNCDSKLFNLGTAGDGMSEQGTINAYATQQLFKLNSRTMSGNAKEHERLLTALFHDTAEDIDETAAIQHSQKDSPHRIIVHSSMRED